MASNWEVFIDNLKDDAGKLAKDELKALVKATKNDSEAFIKKQGEKLERYLDQLAASAITKAQFKEYVEDIRDLTELEKLKMSVAAKASAQRLADGITSLVIDGLLSLV